MKCENCGKNEVSFVDRSSITKHGLVFVGHGLELVHDGVDGFQLPGAVIAKNLFHQGGDNVEIEHKGYAGRDKEESQISNQEVGHSLHPCLLYTSPYIMMHMQGTPQNMQQHPHYDNLLKEVFMYFARKVQRKAWEHKDFPSPIHLFENEKSKFPDSR